MNDRRELVSGLLAALVSIIIIGGSLAISFAESIPGIPEAIAITASATPSPTPAVPTPRPGEPTLTPSPTQLPATPTVLSPTPSCQIPPGWIVITVNPGDTLEFLAETYQTTTEVLTEENCLLIDRISPGSQLYVPELHATLTPTKTRKPRPSPTYCPGPPYGWVLYTVKAGDTLYSIGQAHGGVSPTELQAANCMGNSTIIKVGEQIWVPYVPAPTPTSSTTPSTTTSPIPTDQYTPTVTSTPSQSATSSPTSTPTAIPQDTMTPTFTPTPTQTATSTPTSTNTALPEPSSTPTDTPIPYP